MGGDQVWWEYVPPTICRSIALNTGSLRTRRDRLFTQESLHTIFTGANMEIVAGQLEVGDVFRLLVSRTQYKVISVEGFPFGARRIRVLCLFKNTDLRRIRVFDLWSDFRIRRLSA